MMSILHLLTASLLMVVMVGTINADPSCSSETETLNYQSLMDGQVDVAGTNPKPGKDTVSIYALQGSGSFFKPSKAVQDPYWRLMLLLDEGEVAYIEAVRFDLKKATSVSIDIEQDDGFVADNARALHTMQDHVESQFSGVEGIAITLTFVRSSPASSIKLENLEVDIKRCSPQ